MRALTLKTIRYKSSLHYEIKLIPNLKLLKEAVSSYKWLYFSNLKWDLYVENHVLLWNSWDVKKNKIVPFFLLGIVGRAIISIFKRKTWKFLYEFKQIKVQFKKTLYFTKHRITD